jgi:restriction system protein
VTLALAEPLQTKRTKLRALDWYQFEKLIALLFQEEGFAVQRKGGANADGGIDLLAVKNGITFGVQCKFWKSWRVNVKEVRSFFGALQDFKLRNGFLITLEGYTPDAKDFATRNGIDLMDERSLLDNLESVNWFCKPGFLQLLTDKRKVCPKCESEMLLKTAKKGAKAGQQFWGCSNYPRCRFTFSAQ